MSTILAVNFVIQFVILFNEPTLFLLSGLALQSVNVFLIFYPMLIHTIAQESQ